MSEAPRRLHPPLLFLIALALEVAAAYLLPGERLVPWPWSLAGLVLIVGGVVMSSAGSQQFARAATEISPFGSPSKLVTDGLYRFSRNPMYLGMLLLLVGVAVGIGNGWALLFPALLGVVLDVRFVRMEERKMTAIFGEGFERYRRRVRRWI